MEKYFIGLDKMSLDELEIYRLLCRYSNYETDVAGYTIQQLLVASDSRLGLTTQRIRTILKKFEKDGYIQFLTSGSKGKESTLKLTIKQQLFNNNSTNKNEELQEVEDLANNNLTTKQQLTNNTTKKKKKENKKDIYIDAFTEIFDAWNNGKIIVHKKQTDLMVKAYKKALKEYTHEEIKEAIENYSRVIASDFYYSYKFSLDKFLVQGNAISRFVKDGDVYINYLEANKKGPIAVGPHENKKTNYDNSICKREMKNTPVVKEFKFV